MSAAGAAGLARVDGGTASLDSCGQDCLEAIWEADSMARDAALRIERRPPWVPAVDSPGRQRDGQFNFRWSGSS